MKGVGPGIFSIQAVLVSLALHVIVIGGLFTLGKPESDLAEQKPPAEAAAADAPERRDEGPDVKKPEADPVKADSVKTENEKPPEKPETKEKKPESEVKPPARSEPVEIRIEPAKKTESADRKVAQSDEEKTEVEDAAGGKTRVYVVKRGDTLTALARDCGLTVSELAKLNGKTVKKLSNLRIGQRIKLPVKD